MKQLSPSSLANQVSNLIKEDILENKYSPNQRLNEVEISSALGISRGPIREAFQRLSHEGFLKLVPNKGAFIISFSKKEVEDIYELRENLEIMSLKLAADRGDASDFRNISDLLKDAEKRIRNSGNVFYPWDSDFHVIIAKCTKNKMLEEYIRKLNTQTHLIRYRSGSKHGRATEAFKEHIEIYRALYERDGEKAARLMVHHIRTSRNNIMQLISDEE